MKIIKDDEQRRRFGALRQLIMYMLRYKLIFACVVVVVIASNLLALVIPQLTGVIVDALVPGNVDFDVVVSNVINIALIGLASYVLSVLQNVLMLHAAQRVVVDLRHDVFQKLSRLPVSFFDGNTKGNILAILVSDIDNISDTVSSDAITLLTGMVTLVGAITMMLRISPRLTLVFAVTVPIMCVVAYFVKNRARVLFREKKNWFGRLCGYAEEMITAQKTIKVYGIEDFNEQKFDDMSEKLRAAGSKAEFASSTMMPQMNFINNLNYIDKLLPSQSPITPPLSPTSNPLSCQFSHITPHIFIVQCGKHYGKDRVDVVKSNASVSNDLKLFFLRSVVELL